MKVIQFPHPGNEQHYSKQELAAGIKNWNSNKTHARNFIHADGTYIDSNGVPQKDSLTFWGEWEPPAKVQKLQAVSGTDMPKYVIEPIMPVSSPFPGQMNTDPLVFGKYFKYAICRQNQRSVVMKNLNAGSIILFGCVRGTDFLLDTVFVVNNSRKFLLSDKNSLLGIDEYGKYKKIVLDTFFFKKNSCGAIPRKQHELINGCGCKNIVPLKATTMNTYYEGARYDNPVNGMYSFVPAEIYDANNIGFERLKLDTLKQFPELHYKNLQNFYTVMDSSSSNVKDFWNRLCTATENSGLVKAVEISYP